MQSIMARLRPGQKAALVAVLMVITVYWVALVGLGGPPPHVVVNKPVNNGEVQHHEAENIAIGSEVDGNTDDKAVVVDDKPRVELIVRLDGQKERVLIEIDRYTAPITAANFIALVKQGFYNGCVFYRAEPGFVLQGGARDMSGRSKKPPYRPIPLEAKLPNNRGTISMARSNDPNSASTEFFINIRDNNGLNAKEGPRPNGYAAFGTVIEGMSVIDRAVVKPTAPGSGIHFLLEPVEIVLARVLH